MSQKRMSAVAKANGGIDSVRALSHARNVLLHHDLKQPVLYHLVLTGSQDIATYQAVIKSLVRRIRARCRLEYFGAYENDETKGKHAHCFILIETSKKTPFKIMDVNDGEYLHKLAERHGLVNAEGETQRIHVAKPKNRMHAGQFFARPVKADGLLDNCLEWAEYEYKKRSKGGMDRRETYFNSEFAANKVKRAEEMQQYYAPAAPAAAPIDSKGNEIEEESTTKPEASSNEPTFSPIGSLRAEEEGNNNKALVSTGYISNANQSTSHSEASTESKQFDSPNRIGTYYQAAETKVSLRPHRKALEGPGSDYKAPDESAHQIRFKPRISPLNAFSR